LDAEFEDALLHNGNKYHLVPAEHAIHMKKSYNNMHLLVTYIKYNKYS
jgi:hypothetical protein